jgi:hypothetical protein
MALSCSTQLLQRSWRVYLSQGTLRLASSAAGAGGGRFRSRAFTSSSYILRSRTRVSERSFPVWRPRHGSSPFGFQSVRALSASAPGSGPALAEASEEEHAAKGLKEFQAGSEATATALEVEDQDSVQKNADPSPSGLEEHHEIAVNAALQEDVEQALGSVDLLNDASREESENGDEFESLQDQHPWPEWESFLNMLEVGGHFIFDTETTDRRPVVRQEDDAGKIKRASMAFARNRDDVLKYENLCKPGVSQCGSQKLDAFYECVWLRCWILKRE